MIIPDCQSELHPLRRPFENRSRETYPLLTRRSSFLVDLNVSTSREPPGLAQKTRAILFSCPPDIPRTLEVTRPKPPPQTSHIHANQKPITANPMIRDELYAGVLTSPTTPHHGHTRAPGLGQNKG
ncbi:hypothetical protein RRG08_031090 [Elysia crispata]|uniref:Uncharacterized protein n=1 Tax=Elysia crispata TaxID=231223 RepID=A0AAE1DG67_9GAST|nr:hypothetical protein RRG08_031090 [Elysia crispata]